MTIRCIAGAILRLPLLRVVRKSNRFCFAGWVELAGNWAMTAVQRKHRMKGIVFMQCRYPFFAFFAPLPPLRELDFGSRDHAKLQREKKDAKETTQYHETKRLNNTKQVTVRFLFAVDQIESQPVPTSRSGVPACLKYFFCF
jgi:hypothetical protein